MDIRHKLIRKILGSDKKNINKRVAAIQKRKIANYEEETHPYLQINDDDVEKMKRYTASLRQILEKKD